MITAKKIARIFNKLGIRLGVARQVCSQFDDALDRCQIKPSFSQSGEDMIAWYLLNYIGIPRPSYLDVGAHHPLHLSNTALFHLLGGHGINIEPDPLLFREFLRSRPRDINLNIGIGRVSGNMVFYRMADPSLSTFSEEEAIRMEKEEGIHIEEKLNLPVRTIDEVLAAHQVRPDFVSIDVEGRDLEVLESFDFAAHRPAVFCVETISFSLKQAGKKDSNINSFLGQQGYGVYADTYINTLFVDRARFRGVEPK